MDKSTNFKLSVNRLWAGQPVFGSLQGHYNCYFHYVQNSSGTQRLPVALSLGGKDSRICSFTSIYI